MRTQKNKVSIIIGLNLLMFLSSCEQERKFDKKTWCSYSDLDLHEERNKMIDDLLENYDLKGMTTKDVQEFFGYIENIDTLNKPFNIQYNVFTDYGWDIDPVHTKTLMIYLNDDFKVKSVKLSEWKR
jgi:hypothetical protein